MCVCIYGISVPLCSSANLHYTSISLSCHLRIYLSTMFLKHICSRVFWQYDSKTGTRDEILEMGQRHRKASGWGGGLEREIRNIGLEYGM